MKSKLKLIGSAIFAVMFVFGCSEQNSDKAAKKEKDDAVIKAVPKTVTPDAGSIADAGSTAVAVTAKGKKVEAKAGKAAKEIAGGAVSAFPQKTQQPQPGVTLKEFFNQMELPEVVATIGNEKITKENLIKDIEAQIPQQMRNQPLPPQVTAGLAQNLKTVVDTMISRKLLLKLAAADGIKPSARMLIDKFNAYLEKLPPQQQEAFKKQLAAKGSSIEKHKADAVKDVGAQEAVAIDKWIETKILPSVTVDDATAEKFYRENQNRFKKPTTVQVAHVLIAPEKPSPDKLEKMSAEEKKKFAEEADKTAKAKADELLIKAKKGEDFAKLAKDNSICPSGKSEGGVLPEFDKTGAIAGAGPRGGRMDKDFTAASYQLKPGEISGVVKTAFGYHIIKSIKKTEESYIPFEKVKGYLLSSLKKEELSKKVKAMLDAEKEKSNVKIFVK
jgi:peptidyl-prolyl cis-trans isomerase C